MLKCSNCGLIVESISEFSENECPDNIQHNFVEAKRVPIIQARLKQCDTCLHDREGDCGGVVALQPVNPDSNCDDYEVRL